MSCLNTGWIADLSVNKSGMGVSLRQGWVSILLSTNLLESEWFALLLSIKCFQCYVYTMARPLFGDWNPIQLLYRECFPWALFLPRPMLLHHRLYYWYILFSVCPWGNKHIPAASWACAGWTPRIVASTTYTPQGGSSSSSSPLLPVPSSHRLIPGYLAKLTGVTSAALS